MQSAKGFVAGSLPSGEIGFRLTYARQFRHGQATGERGTAHFGVLHRSDPAQGRANSTVAQGGRHHSGFDTACQNGVAATGAGIEVRGLWVGLQPSIYRQSEQC